MITKEKIPLNILVSLYEIMLKIRKTEELIADLVSRKKILCPCHLYVGQEAIAGGVCANLGSEDYVFSTHRSHGHYLAKGGDTKALLAELFGKVGGCSKGRGGSMHLSAPSIGFPGSSAIVAGTISLAIGAGLAFSLQETKKVSVVFFGDGATNEGVFYESLNFAALRKLPVVFVCENNLYCTHMHISKCLAEVSIFGKAKAFNLSSVQVDGNNVTEIYRVAGDAIRDARNGLGPVLIECLTYRWLGHVGFHDDINKGLRSKEELNYWMRRCPIKILEDMLLGEGLLSEEAKRAILKKIEQELAEALLFAQESPFPQIRNFDTELYKNSISSLNEENL